MGIQEQLEELERKEKELREKKKELKRIEREKAREKEIKFEKIIGKYAYSLLSESQREELYSMANKSEQKVLDEFGVKAADQGDIQDSRPGFSNEY
jgi:flagellar biosynthesis chaperone FliJ